MEVRNAAGSVRFCRMTTEEIRGIFSSRVCLLADTIKLIYSDVDRAVVLFSGDFEDYPLLRRTAGGLPEVCCMPPLFGENLKNIALTGPGIFDGAGQAWRPVKKSKMTDFQWKKLLASGGVVDDTGEIWYPSKEALNGAKTVAQLEM